MLVHCSWWVTGTKYFNNKFRIWHLFKEYGLEYFKGPSSTKVYFHSHQVVNEIFLWFPFFSWVDMSCLNVTDNWKLEDCENAVAQWLEGSPHKREIVGSIPDRIISKTL